MNRNGFMLLGVVLAAAMLGGCTDQPFVTSARLNRGLVMVYTGIEGRSPFNTFICRGLARGGVPYAIERTDWTVGIPGAYLVNLRSETRNREKAAELADRIRRYRSEHPGKPVILVGQSGGAAMAAWTAEALGETEPVDGIIMVAAALSPGYPLDEALDGSRRGIVSFYSSGDMLFLGVGTTMYGTMDGKHVNSAGRVGFRVPDSEAIDKDPRWAGRFYQIPWRPEMVRTGHWGGHTSTSAMGFVADYLAPLVMATSWDDPLIERVANGGADDDAKADNGAVGYHRY